MNLLNISWLMIGLSAFILLTSVSGAFWLEGQVAIGWLVLGHSLIMLSAVGLKLGYILRLEALSRRAKR